MEEPVRILVPVNGSEHSDRAVDTAVSLARATGASLDILFVSYFDSSTDDPDRDSWLPDGVAGPAVKEVNAALERARRRVPEDVPVQLHHQTGIPAKQILAFIEAHDIRTVVLGRRGLGIVESFLMGSISQEILEIAPCAVVIVK